MHKLLDSIVLVELEARSELNGLVELGDLSSQLADDLAGLFFLFLGGLDQFPSLVDLFLEQANGRTVLLGQLDGGLDTRGVLDDDLVEVLDLADETLLRVVGGLESAMELLVLSLEALHSLFADHGLEDFLEVALKGLVEFGRDAHLQKLVFVISHSYWFCN